MSKHNKNENWLNSSETKKLLKINDCELMHRRERGELKFEKRGRAYFYLLREESEKK